MSCAIRTVLGEEKLRMRFLEGVEGDAVVEGENADLRLGGVRVPELLLLLLLLDVTATWDWCARCCIELGPVPGGRWLADVGVDGACSGKGGRCDAGESSRSPRSPVPPETPGGGW